MFSDKLDFSNLKCNFQLYTFIKFLKNVNFHFILFYAGFYFNSIILFVSDKLSPPVEDLISSL